MGYEVFQTGLSIADLVLAAIGLIGSSSLAGRTMAVARLRVDARLDLFQSLTSLRRDLIGLASGFLTAWPAEVSTDSFGQVKETVDEYREKVDQMILLRRKVRLLPWVDRETWSRFEPSLRLDDIIAVGNAGARELNRFQDGGATTMRSTLSGAAEIAQSMMTQDPEEASDALDSLLSYLEWQLRPGRWRRLLLWRHVVNLLYRKLAWWS